MPLQPASIFRLRIALVLILLLLGILSGTPEDCPARKGQLDAGDSAVMWRLTEQGWQDIGWQLHQPTPPQPMLENVHPFVWAGLVLISALLLMVATSPSEELNRVFRRRSSARTTAKLTPDANVSPAMEPARRSRAATSTSAPSTAQRWSHPTLPG